MKKLANVADIYESKLTKLGARDRISRKHMSKKLEKAKKEYSKLKDQLDVLDAEDSKRKSQLDATRKNTNDVRKRVMDLHKSMQCMDLSNAQEAIFYNDDSSDVGYLINGKEYHIDFSDTGEMTPVEMRKHRKERKMSQKADANCAEDCAEPEHNHPEKLESTGDENSADDMNMAEDDLDSLYADLLA